MIKAKEKQRGTTCKCIYASGENFAYVKAYTKKLNLKIKKTAYPCYLGDFKRIKTKKWQLPDCKKDLILPSLLPDLTPGKGFVWRTVSSQAKVGLHVFP